MQQSQWVQYISATPGGCHKPPPVIMLTRQPDRHPRPGTIRQDHLPGRSKIK